MSISSKLVLTKEGNYYHPDDPGEIFDGIRADQRRSVTQEEAAILTHLADGLDVLEIGTGLGVSTRALAETAKSLVTVDPDPWVEEMDLSETVIQLNEIPVGWKFDLAFIDGAHDSQSVQRDIENCNAPLMVLHDCYMDGVEKAILNTGIELVEIYQTRCDMRLYRRG